MRRRQTRSGRGRGSLLAIGLLAALLAGACTAADDPAALEFVPEVVDRDRGDASPPSPVDRDPAQPLLGEVVRTGSLAGFEACDALLAHLQAEALARVTPWGLTDGAHGGIFLDELHDGVVPSDPVAEAAPGAGGAPVAGEDVSGTNLQEEGVDEPDRVKTDGRTLYVVTDGHLEVVDVTGSQPRRLASVPLDGAFDAELLLAGDRLLVTSSAPVAVPLLPAPPVPDPVVSDELVGSAPMGDDWVPVAATSTLTLFDVSDPSAPTALQRLTLDGSVRSSRLIDGVARVVVRSEQGAALPWATPQAGGLRAERAALVANQELIRASTIEDWLPWYVHQTAGGEQVEGPLLDCTRVVAPEDFAGFGMLSVLSVDLEDASLLPGPEALGVLAGGDTVYASPDTLYVATVRWPDPGEASGDPWGHDLSTQVHAFELVTPRDVRYLGSGQVPGTLLSQWAMSEHQGVLRVASTLGDAWGPEPSESLVTVLAPDDGALVQLGQVGGLGLTERIYAVRFLGERGYVVTFRETDPLYTIDLSDPTDPREVGELKIMGYSAYLHPIGDDLLIGVGQDADEVGRRLGTQLSLFDVSDDRDPRRIAQVTLGPGMSDVEHDHRAFLHWPATGLTVVPYHRWDLDPGAGWTDESISGAVGFTADRSDGLSRIAELSHASLVREAVQESGWSDEDVGSVAPDLWWDHGHRAQITRSVVVGDRLLTVSGLGIVVHDLATLDDLGGLRFER